VKGVKEEEVKHGLSVSELEFITSIIEKAMVLDTTDRERLFGHLELTVMFFENGSL
jgi:exosome complex RNA-binding protein Rrp42 (RNase PH superfamily)